MTIEIDDSGTGEIVGNAFIGIHRIETGEMIFKEVPVYTFDEYGRKTGKPESKAVDLIKEGLKELNYKGNENIHICQGPFFKYVRDYLNRNKITYISCSIKGILQKEIEEKYVLHLESIGVKLNSELKSKFLEDVSFRNKYLKFWVCKDYINRLKYVRTGYKKAFKNLIKLIQMRYNIEKDDILKYHIQDAIFTLENYCIKNDFQTPCYYFLTNRKWQKEMDLLLFMNDERKQYKVGVSIRKKEENKIYLKNFKFEQKDKNSITAISKGSSFLLRDAKLKASAKICNIFNLVHKPFEESNY